VGVVVVVVVVVVKRKDVFERGKTTQSSGDSSLLSVIGMAGLLQSYSLRGLGSGVFWCCLFQMLQIGFAKHHHNANNFSNKEPVPCGTL
jgi:hypothetical protein